MDEVDRYGLAAQFSFTAESGSFASINKVQAELRKLIQSVRMLEGVTQGQFATQIRQSFRSIATQSQGINEVSSRIQQAGESFKAATKQIAPLKQEFRALRAESRNIEFPSDIYDDKQWQAATQELNQYIKTLRQLEGQVDGNSTVEREFSAQLKAQQNIAASRVEMAGQQRRSAIAAERKGLSESVRSVGQSTLSLLSGPMAEAKTLSADLGTIQKLAGAIGDSGNDIGAVKNQVLKLSVGFATVPGQIDAVYESLAGAGKNFQNLRAINQEVEQILENSKALDVSTEATTNLNIALGSIYKNSLNRYGGLVSLNQKFASSVNVLTDNLQDVAISAEGVLPIVTNLINTVGDQKNFRPEQILAFSAALNSINVEPSLAGSFVNRLNDSISAKAPEFANILGMGLPDFTDQLETDKLGIIIKLVETYKNLSGGELAKGRFFDRLGIGSTQDKAIIQGLSANLGVLQESVKLSSQAFAEGTSVSQEWARVQQTATFQSDRASQAIAALKLNFGLAISDAMVPILRVAGDVLSLFLNLSQRLPFLTKVVAVGTFTFAALATAIGTTGVMLFGLQQASATAQIGLLSLNRSLIPLTGFYESTMMGFAGKNPMAIALALVQQQTSQLLPMLSALVGSIQAVGIAFLSSPIGLAIAGFTGLYLLLEVLTPKFSILGIAIGALTAPIAFVIGLIKGFSSGLMAAIAPLGKGIGHSLVQPFQAVGDALIQAQRIWQQFAGDGEKLGYALSQAVLNPFRKSAELVLGLWQKTTEFLIALFQPLADAAQWVGQLLVGNLAENSPGPTWAIRQYWAMTVDWVLKQLDRLVAGARWVGEKLIQAFEVAAFSIFGTVRHVLVSAFVQKLFPKIAAGVFKSASGSLFSSQKIGNRVAEILSEALVLPFEQDIAGAALIEGFTSLVFRLAELVEGLFVNQLGKPVSKFLTSFVPEWIWQPLGKISPGLQADVRRFLAKVIVAPRELPGIGSNFVAPLLDAFQKLTGVEVTTFKPLVTGLKELVLIIRPFAVLLEKAIPAFVIDGLMRLGPAFSVLAPVLRGFVPVLEVLLPIFGRLFWGIGIVLVAADALRTLALVLRGSSTLVQALASTLPIAIGVITQILSVVEYGIKKLRHGLRDALRSAVASMAAQGMLVFRQLATLSVTTGQQIAQAWEATRQFIDSQWRRLVAIAVEVRAKLVGLLNHGAADYVLFAWIRASQGIADSWHWLTTQAAHIGQLLLSAFTGWNPVALVTGMMDGIALGIQHVQLAISNFHPVAAINHLMAEVVRSSVANLRLIGAVLPLALLSILEPLLEKALIPAMLHPFLRALPLIVGLVADFTNLLQFGPDLPFRQQVNAFFEQTQDDLLALGLLIGSSFAIARIAPFIAQVRIALIPVVQTLYRWMRSTVQTIQELGGIVPYIRNQLATLAASVRIMLSAPLPPWAQALINFSRTTLQRLIQGLYAALRLSTSLVERFVRLPGIRQVLQAVLTGVQVIRQTLAPVFQPLLNWFTASFIPGIATTLSWLRQNIGLLVRWLGAQVRQFIASPIGQMVLKGAIGGATNLLGGAQAIGGFGMQVAGKAAGAVVTTGQKLGEAYLIGEKLAIQINLAFSQLLPYLDAIAQRLGAIVSNTANAAKQTGNLYRSFYLRKLGVPAGIAENAISPLNFMPGAKAKAIRQEKFKLALIEDPFWKAREGTELFNDKLKTLTKSFSGLSGGLNVFKTLPMLFTRPALAASILFAQFELIVGVIGLIVAAGVLLYIAFPKAFKTIAAIVNQTIVPALGMVAWLLVKAIPRAVSTLVSSIDLLGRVLKVVLFDIPATAVVGILFAVDAGLSAVWIAVKGIQYAAIATRVIGSALVASLHGDFSQLLTIGTTVRTFFASLYQTTLTSISTQWQHLVGIIYENQRAIRQLIGSFLMLSGVAMGVAGVLVAIAFPASTLVASLLSIGGLLVSGLGVAILPGQQLADKLSLVSDMAKSVATSAVSLKVSVVNTARTAIDWLVGLVKAIGLATAALTTLYLATVVVVAGLNPIGLAIAGIGAFITLSMTGHLETFTAWVTDWLSGLNNLIRNARDMLISIIQQPFNLDGFFQFGADAIGDFVKGFASGVAKLLPILLIGMTLFNGVFKSGGNLMAGFTKSLKQLPVLFFKLLIQPIFLAIRALSNLTFQGGQAARQFSDSFEGQTAMMGVATSVRKRLPGAGGDNVADAERELAERRKIIQFRKAVNQAVLNEIQTERDFIQLNANTLQRDPASAAGFFSPQEMERLRQYVRTESSNLAGLLNVQTQTMTEAGEQYLQGYTQAVQMGSAHPALGSLPTSVLSADSLSQIAQKTGLNVPGEGQYNPEDLRKLAFGQLGVQDWLAGQIQRIYADRVEIIGTHVAGITEQPQGAASRTVLPSIPISQQLILPKQYSLQQISPDQRDNMRATIIETIRASGGIKGELSKELKTAIDKLLTEPIGALRETQLSTLSKAFGYGFYPREVAREEEKGIPNKNRENERYLAQASVLSKLGMFSSRYIDQFKSSSDLRKMMDDRTTVQAHMQGLGLSPDTIEKTFQAFDRSISGVGDSKSKQQDLFGKHVSKVILDRQVELLLQEAATTSSFSLPGDVPPDYLKQLLQSHITRESLSAMQMPELSQFAKILKVSEESLPGRTKPLQKDALAARVYEVMRAYAYKFEKETGEDIGTQKIPSLRITGALPVLSTTGSTGMTSQAMKAQSEVDFLTESIKTTRQALDKAMRAKADAEAGLSNAISKGITGSEISGIQEQFEQYRQSVIEKQTALEKQQQRLETAKAQTPLPTGVTRDLINQRLQLISTLAKRRDIGTPTVGVDEYGTPRLTEFIPIATRLKPDIAELKGTGQIGGDVKTFSPISRGRFEETDPGAVRQLASLLQITTSELLAGREFSPQEKLGLAQVRANVLESLGSQYVRARGMRGRAAQDYTSATNLGRQAGLSPEDMRGVLMGSGSVNALESLANILEINRSELESKLDKPLAEIGKKKESIGLKGQLQRFVQSPASYIPGPIQGSAYAGAYQSQLRQVQQEDVRQSRLTQKRVTAFDAITQNLSAETSKGTLKGSQALEFIVAQQSGVSGTSLTVNDIRKYLQSGKFSGKPEQASAKMAVLKQISSVLTQQLQSEGLPTSIDLSQLESFNPQSLNKQGIRRLSQELQNVNRQVGQFFTRTQRAVSLAEKDASRATTQQNWLVQRIAGQPVLGRLVELYQDYRHTEEQSLQKLLRQNGMSLSQLQTYLVEVLEVPHEEYAKFLRGHKVNTQTTQALGQLFAGSPQFSGYQNDMEAARVTAQKKMQSLTGEQLIRAQTQLQEKLRKIEEAALRDFFDVRSFTTKPLPSLVVYTMGRLLKEDAPKLARRALQEVWWGLKTGLGFSFTKILPATLKIGLKAGGFALRSISGALYTQFMPTLLRTVGGITSNAVETVGVRLNALRGLFPKSALLGGLQSAILGYSDSLKSYFNSTAIEIESSSRMPQIVPVVRQVLTQIIAATADFIAQLPDQFDRARQQVAARSSQFIALARSAFGNIWSTIQRVLRGASDAVQQDVAPVAQPVNAQPVKPRLVDRADSLIGNTFSGISSVLEKAAKGIRILDPSQNAKLQHFYKSRQEDALIPRQVERYGIKDGRRTMTGTQRIIRLEKVDPLPVAMIKALERSTNRLTNNLSSSFIRAAWRSRLAWQESAEIIENRSWGGLVRRAWIAGKRILGFISEASPGPSYQTRVNWEHTAQAVGEDMHQMGVSANIAGHHITNSMEGTANKSRGIFRHLSGTIGHSLQAGMAIGGAIGAVGMAVQSITSSLSSLGLIDEQTSAAISKFSELVSIVGAAGGVLGPVLGAIVSSLGAIITLGGSAIALVFSPIGLSIAAITAGVLLLNTTISKLFGVDVLGMVTERIWLYLEMPLTAARDRVMQAWQELTDRFYPILAPIVEPAVEIAQRLIAALNCHPTIVIPESWKLAIDQILQQLFGWANSTEWVGQHLAKALDPEWLKQQWMGLQQRFPGIMQKVKKSATNVSVWWKKIFTDQPGVTTTPGLSASQATIAPPVPPPAPPPLPPSWQEQVKQVVGTGIGELGAGWQDRMGLLQQQVDPSVLFTPDLEQVKNSLSTLQGDVAHFGEQAKQSLLKLDFHQLWQDTKDFGGNFAAAAKQIVAGFGSMSLSAVAFGVYSLLSLSPVVLVLGGMTLAAIALATNFLGLRNILIGSIKIIVGTVQALYSVIRGLVEIIVGAGNVIGGVLSALRGDFSQLHQGAQQVMVGIHTIADGVATGLKTGLGGALQLLKGLFEGLGQIANTVLGVLEIAVDQVNAQFQRLNNGVRVLGEVLITAITRPQELWQRFLNLLSQIQSKVRDVMELIQDSTVGRFAKAVGLRISGHAGSMQTARNMVDFDQRLKGRQSTSSDQPGLFQRLFSRKSREISDFDARLSGQMPETNLTMGDRLTLAKVQVKQKVQGVSGNLIGQKQIAHQVQMQRQSVQDIGDSVYALSGVVATFAPTIAGPIFAVSTLFDSFTALSQLLPTVSGFMATLGITSTTTGLKVATSGGIMAVVTGGLSTAFGALGTAATVAWAAITGPLLPIIAIIGLVVVAVMALWKAFQSNFMGIRDQVGRVWGSIQQLGRGILSVLGGTLEFVGKVLLAPVALALNLITQVASQIAQVGRQIATVFEGELATIWQELKNLGRVIVEPFMPLLNLFGKGGSGILGGAISATLAVIMVPLRLVAFILTVIIRSVSFLIQGFIKLGSIIATVVLAPVRMVVGVVQGIVSFIQTIGQSVVRFTQAVAQAFFAPFQMIFHLLTSFTQLPIISNLLGVLLPKQPPQTQPPGFAGGGLVQGPGTGTSDSIHIRASRNEFVMPAKQTLQNYGFLEAIRQGMDVESALQLMPTTPPPVIESRPAWTTTAVEKSEPPAPIMVNITFGDIILGQGAGPEQALQFLETLKPELRHTLQELLRDLVEKSR